MGSFDARLYLNINVFAERTAWAHGFMRIFVLYLGVILLACLVAAAIWRARGGAFALGDKDRLPDAVWTPLAALLAFGLAFPIADVVGRRRPYAAPGTQVEVLVHRITGAASMPSVLAAVAGAVLVGAWLTRDRIVAVLATLIGVFLCFAQVYVGAQYPFDELVGLLLGGIVVAALRPLTLPAISAVRHAVLSLGRGKRSPAVVAAGEGSGNATVTPWVARRVPSPALHQPAPEASSTVRILETDAKVVPHIHDPRGLGHVTHLEPATAHIQNITRVPGAKPADGHDTAPTQATGS